MRVLREESGTKREGVATASNAEDVITYNAFGLTVIGVASNDADDSNVAVAAIKAMT